eukprot:s1110_g2.t1
MARYKPYLEAIGPQSVDNFICTGDRVVNALRSLDRLEHLSKAAALPGAVPVQRTYLQAGEDADEAEDEEEPEEEDEDL